MQNPGEWNTVNSYSMDIQGTAISILCINLWISHEKDERLPIFYFTVFFFSKLLTICFIFVYRAGKGNTSWVFVFWKCFTFRITDLRFLLIFKLFPSCFFQISLLFPPSLPPYAHGSYFHEPIKNAGWSWNPLQWNRYWSRGRCQPLPNWSLG